MQVGTCPNVLEYMRLPDSTPQWHTVTILGIKLSHLVYLGSFFLDPEDIKSLSLGAIWNFSKGTGLSWTGIRLWGSKGLYLRPRCIRTIRAQTQLLTFDQSINQSINQIHWIELNLFAFFESQTGTYLGYRTSREKYYIHCSNWYNTSDWA